MITSVSNIESEWKSLRGNETFGNSADMAESCQNLNMPESAYNYMCQPNGLWCCTDCYHRMKILINNEGKRSETEPYTIKIWQGFDTTMNNINKIMF